jgi:hypothetical protein
LHERVEIHRSVEKRFRQTPARGAADLHRLEALALGDSTAGVEDEGAKCSPGWYFNQPWMD